MAGTRSRVARCGAQPPQVRPAPARPARRRAPRGVAQEDKPANGLRSRARSRGGTLSLAKTRSEGSRPNSSLIRAVGHGPQERQRKRITAERSVTAVECVDPLRARIACSTLRRKLNDRGLRSAADVAVVEAADLSIAAQAGLTGDPRPAWRPIFWPTTTTAP